MVNVVKLRIREGSRVLFDIKRIQSLIVIYLLISISGCASNLPYEKDVSNQLDQPNATVWVFWQKSDQQDTLMGGINSALEVKGVRIYVDNKNIDESLYLNTHAVLKLRPGKRRISFLAYSLVLPLGLVFGRPNNEVSLDLSTGDENYVVYINSSNDDGMPGFCDKAGCFDGYGSTRSIMAFKRGNPPPAISKSTRQFLYIEP